MATATSPETPARKPLRGIKTGVVVSDKRDKTRTVMVQYQGRHVKYGKYLRKRTKIQVHDPENVTKNGDHVEVAACRPVSKTKTWRVVRVLGSAETEMEHQT
ncbi:MAG: 30S ribosomal protein S17 [Phycisphaeraceae bacterium]|nr:30S ribosomal protein S17 [Phycisphaeraceae bacterium]